MDRFDSPGELAGEIVGWALATLLCAGLWHMAMRWAPWA